MTVKLDLRYYRPTGMETLLCDSTTANQKLGWTSKIVLPKLLREMVEADCAIERKESLVMLAGSRPTSTTSKRQIPSAQQ